MRPVPASRTTGSEAPADALSTLPDPHHQPVRLYRTVTAGAGVAPAAPHLGRVLSDVRVPARHRPYPGALRAPRRPPGLPGVPPGRPVMAACQVRYFDPAQVGRGPVDPFGEQAGPGRS